MHLLQFKLIQDKPILYLKCMLQGVRKDSSDTYTQPTLPFKCSWTVAGKNERQRVGDFIHPSTGSGRSARVVPSPVTGVPVGIIFRYPWVRLRSLRVYRARSAKSGLCHVSKVTPSIAVSFGHSSITSYCFLPGVRVRLVRVVHLVALFTTTRAGH